MHDYLFITLDSCRYDTFINANCPNIKDIGQIHQAFANGNYTYASHSSMFVGFTPGNPNISQPFVNPKMGKIFRMTSGGYRFIKDLDHIVLEGRNIVDGFNRKGYVTIGTAAMGWFDPSSEISKNLISDFKKFRYTGTDIDRQVEFILSEIKNDQRPKFVFMNIGETHVPYYHKGASWDREYNPCLPFGKNNSRPECETRQKACLEYIDDKIKPILEMFPNGNVVICSDHGDCWGEDGLWEHGIHHDMVLTVPLIYKLDGHD